MNEILEYGRKIKDLLLEEEKWSSGKMISKKYVKKNNYRVEKLLDVCKKYKHNDDTCVLDVGRSELTNKLSDVYDDVYSIGFDLDSDEGGHREVEKKGDYKHISYDLNESKDIKTWPKYENYFDLILYCQTIEHLYTAPEYSVMMLSSLLKKNGIMIITTPNAVSFIKRVKMFFGYNPYERIRYNDRNPGHYREYTRKEMIDICSKSNVVLREIAFKTYKRYKFLHFVLMPFYVYRGYRDTLVVILEKC